MDSPVLNKRYYNNESLYRGEENFQYFLFKDLDFKENNLEVSFFRSDFRGVKIDNVKFYKNNFDRADFINAYIVNSSFENCIFGTDFSNVIFNNVKFTGNIEDTCAFHNCNFLGCTFESESVVNTTIRESKYSKCVFKNCNLEKNSFDDIHFLNTQFEGINFAEMGAYNFDFISCKFSNTTVDPDYLGSYMAKDTDLKQLKYVYRGHEIELTGTLETDLKTLGRFYLDNNRYHEALNSLILYNSYNKNHEPIGDFVKNILSIISKDSHELRQKEQLDRIIKILIFYSDSKLLDAKDLFIAINYLEIFEINFREINDRITYNNNIQLLKEVVKANIFELEIWNFDMTSIVYSEIEINEEDFEDCKLYLKEYYKSISEMYFEGALEPTYQILGTRKGSLIIELASMAVGLYCLAAIAKSIISKVLEIKMEYRISQKTTKLLISDKVDTLLNWEKKVKVARGIQKKPADELYKTAAPLLRLMKAFNIYPNASIKRIDKN